MPIPTSQQFKINTRLAAHGLRVWKARDIRGANIKKIDGWLEQYDRVRGGTPAQKTPVLSNLLAECGRWLKSKRASYGSTTAARRAVIANLGMEVFVELRLLASLHGIDHYNYRKLQSYSGVPHPHQLKPLAAGYANERNMYLAHLKTMNPFAAAAVKGADLHDIVGSRAVDLALKQRINAILAKPFDALTAEDFEAIGAGYKASQYGQEIGVMFAKKEMRASEVLVVWPGIHNDFETQTRAAYDTSTEPTGYMYAMDSYGNLFASKPMGLAHGGQYWNHSSFNAGKDVVCAGMIKIIHGNLRHVDNESGHYKPTRDNLFEIVTAFHNEGIDLQNTTVVIKEQVPGRPGEMELHTVTATQFLANRHIRDPHPQPAGD